MQGLCASLIFERRNTMAESQWQRMENDIANGAADWRGRLDTLDLYRQAARMAQDALHLASGVIEGLPSAAGGQLSGIQKTEAAAAGRSEVSGKTADGSARSDDTYI